jgi:hypothetical protein
MASAALGRGVGKVVGYPQLSEMDDLQRREFYEALLGRRRLRGPARQVPGGAVEAPRQLGRDLREAARVRPEPVSVLPR